MLFSQHWLAPNLHEHPHSVYIATPSNKMSFPATLRRSGTMTLTIFSYKTYIFYIFHEDINIVYI